MSDYQSAQRTVVIPAIRCFLMMLLLTLTIALPVTATEAPDVMLANVYRQHEDVMSGVNYPVRLTSITLAGFG